MPKNNLYMNQDHKNIHQQAIDQVVEDMKSFRSLTKEKIIAIIDRYRSSNLDPLSETDQDVWWAYQRAYQALLKEKIS